MSRVLVLAVLLVALAALVAPSVPTRAAPYQPEDPWMSLGVGPDGRGQAIPLMELKTRRVKLVNQSNPTLKNAEGKNPDRDALVKRGGERQWPRPLTPTQAAVVAGEQLRLGNPDQAMNTLKPTPPVPAYQSNYFVLTTLAEIHAQTGLWRDAVRMQSAAVFDVEPPRKVDGLTPEQWDWQRRLDQDYLLSYFAQRAEEADQKLMPEAEGPAPLFPVRERRKPHDPVRFVDARGGYTPGELAPAERAKLPPDAVAVVQQLLLWSPGDARLYWLLGELYAANGQLEDARVVMDDLVSEAWKYSRPKLLNDHRAAIRQVTDGQRKAEAERQAREEADRRAAEEAEQKAVEEAAKTGRYATYAVFGVAGAAVVVALARVLARRGCGTGLTR